MIYNLKVNYLFCFKGPFPCKVCPLSLGVEFETWAKYRKHMKEHQEDRKFKCKECPQTFNVEKNLRLHFATHDPISLICPECSRGFTRVSYAIGTLLYSFIDMIMFFSFIVGKLQVPLEHPRGRRQFAMLIL